jgi:hypothetical protein
MKGVSLKWLLLGLALVLAVVLVAPAGARLKVKPCNGNCDDGDGPPIPAVPAGPAVNVDPPPIDDGDQPADPPDASSDSTPTSTATVPQVVTVPTQPASRAATTTTVAPAPKLPPICINRPEFGQGPLQPGWIKNADGTCSIDVCLNRDGIQSGPPPGWRASSDGNCYEIPKLDMTLSQPLPVTAPGGAANFTMTIVNNGSNTGTGTAFRLHLDGDLSLVSLKASQGDPCGMVDGQTFVCSTGTIQTGQSVTFSISLKSTGAGTVTAYAEPGGEADTDTTNDHRTIPVVLTALQTELSVQQHGLLWGGHYIRNPQIFARVLAREGVTWKGWKKNHPALAAGLIAHQAVARQHKK